MSDYECGGIDDIAASVSMIRHRCDPISYATIIQAEDVSGDTTLLNELDLIWEKRTTRRGLEHTHLKLFPHFFV